jgi:hypothetical protein
MSMYDKAGKGAELKWFASWTSSHSKLNVFLTKFGLWPFCMISDRIAISGDIIVEQHVVK